MPNWVFTSMTVLGKEEDLIKFRDKAGKSYKTFHKGDFVEKEDGTKSYDSEIVKESLHEAPISFMNFATPADLDAYYGASDYKPEGYEEMTFDERMAHSKKTQMLGLKATTGMTGMFVSGEQSGTPVILR